MPHKIKSVNFARVSALLLLIATAAIVYFHFFPGSPQKIDIARLNIAQSILSKNPAQGHRLFVFESSDCVFCRQIHPELAKVQDARIHTFILPGRTETSRADAQAAWCAVDPAAAWNAIMVGNPSGGRVKPCDTTALDKNVSDARSIGLTVTPTLIDSRGRILVGFHTASEINKWLATD